MAQERRSILKRDLFAPALLTALNDAAVLTAQGGQRLLTPEALLLVLLRDPEGSAQRILSGFAQERGFDLRGLEREIERLTHFQAGRDGQLDFVDAHGATTPLASETVIVLDEALAISHAMDELHVMPEHVLAAMSQKGLSTAGVLQRHGPAP
jgi:ATP-dependent Clp protease ATP-binding subunit ClpA